MVAVFWVITIDRARVGGARDEIGQGMNADDRTRAHEALQMLQGLLLEQPPTPPEHMTSSRRRHQLLQAAQDGIAWRNLRRDVLGHQFSGEPCWDMLLCLYTNWAEGRRISVTDIAHETGIATATVTRWLTALTAEAMVDRDGDPTDGRRIWIRLTRASIEKIERILELQAFGRTLGRRVLPLAA